MLLVLLVVPFAVPLLAPGWLQSHEGLSYPQRLVQVARCWDDGLWSARWFPDFNNGQGYPFLSFYAPFLFFFAGGLHAAGASLTLAFKIPVVLGAVAGAAGAYRLARFAVPPAGAFVAAALYAYAPYRLRDIFVRGDLTEFVATGILPWALFALVRLGRAESRGPRDILLAAAIGGLAILTHNILGMFTGVMMLAATLCTLAFSRERIRTGMAAAAAGILTLWMTAFFWASALHEKQFVQIDAMTEGVLSIDRNFIDPVRLIGPAEYPGLSQDLPMSFELGWPVLAALLALPWALRRRGARSRTVVAIALVAFLGGLFLSTTAARPVYDALPLLRFVQFPWRYLTLVSLGAAVLGGIGVGALLESRGRAVRVGTAVAFAVFAVLAARPLLGPKRNIDLPAWAIDPEKIAANRITTTSSGEYLPIWVTDRELSRGFETGIRTVGDAVVSDADRRVGHYRFRVEAAAPDTVILRDVYYPGWQAKLDGAEHPVGPRPGSGQMQIAVEAGRHEADVRLTVPTFRRNARRVSLAGIGLALITLGAGLRRRSGKEGS